jgi:hypothetical protein
LAQVIFHSIAPARFLLRFDLSNVCEFSFVDKRQIRQGCSTNRVQIVPLFVSRKTALHCKENRESTVVSIAGRDRRATILHAD